ncbi:hypothetical protein FA95DRAFT_397877 [Auriscalpium vulgare]|uniref:Uncharacterized protein n=1 Tax=Auriscalpium vulgare TaxID=40419 RepID=A0ACB8RGW1_9AGAM|nr:hypothetical protein FA95DRAFT_397877 [Auriscalpium vulgare]
MFSEQLARPMKRIHRRQPHSAHSHRLVPRGLAWRGRVPRHARPFRACPARPRCASSSTISVASDNPGCAARAAHSSHRSRLGLAGAGAVRSRRARDLSSGLSGRATRRRQAPSSPARRVPVCLPPRLPCHHRLASCISLPRPVIARRSHLRVAESNRTRLHDRLQSPTLCDTYRPSISGPGASRLTEYTIDTGCATWLRSVMAQSRRRISVLAYTYGEPAQWRAGEMTGPHPSSLG